MLKNNGTRPRSNYWDGIYSKLDKKLQDALEHSLYSGEIAKEIAS
jgi:hypothetical protein